VFDRSQIHKGMVVRSSEGKRLGRVLTADEGAFTVEKGHLWPTDYVAHYEDVTDISGERIRLARAEKELAHLKPGSVPPEHPRPEPQCYGDEGGGGRG